MRKWSVEIYLLDQQGKQHKADCFQKVVYNLHPSFENPVQSEFYRTQTSPSDGLLLIAFQPSPTHRSSARMRDGASSR